MSEQKPAPLSIIYDWETTDKRPSSAVASIAVIVFNPNEMLSFDELVGKALRVKFKINEQFNIGRTWNKDTVEWWQHPDQAEAYAKVIAPSHEDVSISQFNELLSAYLTKMGFDYGNCGKVWTRGNSFDPPILSNIYEYFGWDEPFPWWDIRDVRTEIDAITPYWDDNHKGYGYVNEFDYPEGFIKHKEEHDCARDILMMQYTHLKLIDKMDKEGIA